MKDLPKSVLAFIQSQWGASDPLCMPQLNVGAWQALAERAFRDQCNRVGEIRPPMPFCVRLVGQSGAGKTSQLLPAIQYALKVYHQPYMRLAVRDFAPYHPNATAIQAKYGNQFREKTNAFALTLLTYALPYFVQSRVPIVFEVTLLAPVYETWAHDILNRYGYGCDYHCLAVPKNLSDTWIQERCQAQNRVVSQRSSNFFFTTLASAFLSLQALPIKNRVFLWDCFHKVPEQTHLSDPKLWQRMVTLANATLPRLDFETLLQAKKDFLEKFYQENGFLIENR